MRRLFRLPQQAALVVSAFAPFATLAYSIIQKQGKYMVRFAGIHWVPGN